MRGEVIRFNVCLYSYYICPNLFLQLPILYSCNQFPNSIDNAMALLLVTSLLLLYFSPSAHSLKAGTNRYYHRKLHSIWGILLSQIKHDSFLISCCSQSETFPLKNVSQSLVIYPFSVLDASRTWASEPDQHTSHLTQLSEKTMARKFIINPDHAWSIKPKPRLQRVFLREKIAFCPFLL